MTLDRWLTDEEYARAASKGINRKLLNYRVYQAKWALETAITAPPGTVRHSPEGKYTKWIKLATENGICKGTFYSRVNSGWSYKDAATKPPKRKSELGKMWLEIAKTNGIGYQTFMSRINTRNWDVEKAATTPLIRTGRNCSIIDKEKVL
ncbi:nucleoside permease [Lysinibacillus capsici]|uniref:nucleoside permease n=1 Tax=Lysinibacillus capsici TaxID=2115968 RepID=UPI0034E2B6F1